MPVRSQVIAQWAKLAGWETPLTAAEVVPGPYVPKMPDRVAIVTATSGPGYVLDGAADQSGYQARIRGLASSNDEQSYGDAESLAFLWDRLVYEAVFPVVVMDTVIVEMRRAGGQPAPMTPSPDDADRYTFVCNYVVITGVN